MLDVLSCEEDHPRSRGVYPSLRSQYCFARGSSPLARGLLLRRGNLEHALGIIPARAGFTRDADDGHCVREDHPRSRGVYIAMDLKCELLPGSSPLARGLRDTWRNFGWENRIIPARAGFTPLLRGWRRGSWDHPRSRGVYSDRARPATSQTGSSPLARGLPQTCPESFRATRIIPARAGFTWARRHGEARRQDHPRSRGVYLSMITGVASAGGSSPLARGLLAPGNSFVDHAGIIPARAGFTNSPGRTQRQN